RQGGGVGEAGDRRGVRPWRPVTTKLVLDSGLRMADACSTAADPAPPPLGTSNPLGSRLLVQSRLDPERPQVAADRAFGLKRVVAVGTGVEFDPDIEAGPPMVMDRCGTYPIGPRKGPGTARSRAASKCLYL